ncbi:MAG TPA: isoamylase early set domain-containing protein [Longimicrobiales bacterium]|nr:isoamylase early set domain-containing protein [Longimicrobiales bacterium]
MTELDPRLERWIAPLRGMPGTDPAALARLRAGLRREATRGPERRRVVLTPAGAGMAALAVALLTSVVWLAAGRLGAGATGGGPVPVQFLLHAPEARSVAVVGDFNDWDPRALPMTEEGDGVWSVVVPLTPGTIRYSFLVNGGEWRADPDAAAAPGDFGRPSSIALVASTGGRK